MNPVTVASMRIRHTKIAVTAEGCIDCGNSTGSRAWHDAKRVSVTIDKKVFDVVLFRCDDCERKQTPLFQAAAQK